MSRISDLRNLGPKSESWLNEIGVFTLADVRRVGSVEICRLLKHQGLPASLNLVYAIEAMLLEIDWRELPPQLKAELEHACQTRER